MGCGGGLVWVSEDLFEFDLISHNARKWHGCTALVQVGYCKRRSLITNQFYCRETRQTPALYTSIDAFSPGENTQNYVSGRSWFGLPSCPRLPPPPTTTTPPPARGRHNHPPPPPATTTPPPARGRHTPTGVASGGQQWTMPIYEVRRHICLMETYKTAVCPQPSYAYHQSIYICVLLYIIRSTMEELASPHVTTFRATPGITWHL